MDEKTKQGSFQAVGADQLEKVTGGASFDRYKGYVITCRDCWYKWEEPTVKPKKCSKCGSTNIDVYCAFE